MVTYFGPDARGPRRPLEAVGAEGGKGRGRQLATDAQFPRSSTALRELRRLPTLFLSQREPKGGSPPFFPIQQSPRHTRFKKMNDAEFEFDLALEREMEGAAEEEQVAMQLEAVASAQASPGKRARSEPDGEEQQEELDGEEDGHDVNDDVENGIENADAVVAPPASIFGCADDDVDSNYDEGEGEGEVEGEEAEGADEAEMEEPTTTDTISRRIFRPWQLGQGIHPIPPDDSRSSVHSDWAPWSEEMNGKFRAVRHMCMNRMLHTRDADASMCSYRNYTDGAHNLRVIATAAIEGLMIDPGAKGFFFDKHHIVDLPVSLPEDGKAREKAVREMPPLNAFMFKHCFKTYVDANGHQDPESPQFEAIDNRRGVRAFSYTAPSFVFVVETLFAEHPNDDTSFEPLGDEIGTRVHKFVFNRSHSDADHAQRTMEESNRMRRSGRASRAANEWRTKDVGPEKAAKQQRAMVASRDVHKHSSMMYARICNVFDLTKHLNAATGSLTDSSTRNVYPDMNAALGNSSMNKELSGHPTLGSTHALSPEHIFNARDGADPPVGLFPADDNPEHEAERRANAERRARPGGDQDRAYVAFLTDLEGVAVKLNRRQRQANFYMDDNGFMCFPYPQHVQLLTNYSRPIRDATLPLKLNLGVAIGPHALEAFWITMKDDSVVRGIEADVLTAMLPADVDPSDEHARERAFEQLRSQGYPRFEDVRSQIVHLFDDRMRKDKADVNTTRLGQSVPVNEDSLDKPEASATLMEEGDAKPPPLANKVAGTAIDAVHKQVDEAFLIRMGRDKRLKAATVAVQRAKTAVSAVDKSDVEAVARAVCKVDEAKAHVKVVEAELKAWHVRAKTEAVEWGLRLQLNTMTSHANRDKLFPVSREIWTKTLNAIRILPTFFTHARVDHTHPKRMQGSINLAFGFNLTEQFSAQTPYAAYRRLLHYVYGDLSGIQGRVFSGRDSLHYASFAPVGDSSFKPMFFRNGMRGLNKTGECHSFQFLFNASWFPEIEVAWWQNHGEGSAQSMRAGGITPSSGGVAWADEALKAVATGGVNHDPTAQEKLQDYKSKATGIYLSRPRAYKVQIDDGRGKRDAFRMMNDYTIDSTMHVFACNTGCNSVYKPSRGAPPRPDAERRAFLDRSYSIPVTEGARANVRIKSEREFHADCKAEGNVANLWTYTLMTRLTYMLVDCVVSVEAWKPINWSYAKSVWHALDVHMEAKFDIPLPEPRRRTHREQFAIVKAVEAALAAMLLTKESAVAFEAMLPTSEPFDQDATDDDVRETKHTLAPFDIAQLAPVLMTLVVDEEVILDVFSIAFDANMWTTAELHHILMEVGALHGITSPTSATLHCGVAEGRPLPHTVPMQPRNPLPLEPAGGSSSAYFGGGAFDPGPMAPRPIPLAIKTAPSISFGYRASLPRNGVACMTRQDFFARRRVVVMDFLSRCAAGSGAGVVSPSKITDRNVCSRIRDVMKPTEMERDGEVMLCCRLQDGTIETLDAVQDFLLANHQEVTNCGYDPRDLSQWLLGDASRTSFDHATAETIFLGIKNYQWTFLRRADAERNTEDAYDPSWRTCASGAMPRADAQGGGPTDAEASGGAPVEGRLVAMGSRPRAGGGLDGDAKVDRHLWDMAEKIYKRSLNNYHIEALHIYDRLIQILMSTKEYYRKVQVLPDNWRREVACTEPLCKAGATVFRVFPEGKETEESRSDLSAKPDDVVENHIGKDSFVRSGVSKPQRIVPFAAMSYHDTLVADDEQQRLHKAHRPRNEWFATDPARRTACQLNPDDIAQRRLDFLVDTNSLPAVMPLVSTKVDRDCPFKVVNDTFYVNTAFFVQQVRLDYEVQHFISTVPGLRKPEYELSERSDCHMDVDAHTALEASAASPRSHEGTEDVPGEELEAQRLARLAERARLTLESRSIAPGILSRASEIYERAQPRGRGGGAPVPTDDDVHAVCDSMSYSTSENARGPRLVDQQSIFFTLKLHELFNFYDPALLSWLRSSFPAVFPTVEAVQNALPATTCRFLDNLDCADPKRQFLSTTKKFLAPQRSGRRGSAAQPAKKRARSSVAVSVEAIATLLVQENDNPEVKMAESSGVDALEELARSRMQTSTSSSKALTIRTTWRTETVKAGDKLGRLPKAGVLRQTVCDRGLGLIAHARTHYAQHPDEEPGDIADKALFMRGVAFLRPYKPPARAGTHAEIEKLCVKQMLKIAIADLQHRGPWGSCVPEQGDDEDGEDEDGEDEDEAVF